MSARISITSRGDFDNSSDPAVGSLSSGSNVGNDVDSARGNRGPIAPGSDAGEHGGPAGDDEAARVEELRAILGMRDAPVEELRAILRENDRASANARRPANDDERPMSRRTIRRAGRRPWTKCRPAPSRPGIFRVGGPIEVGGTYDVGTTDELDLEVRRIEAASRAREALNESLGRDPRASGEYEQMERRYMEGEQMLASTGLARREGKKKVLPAMVMLEQPPVSRTSMSRKEPALPEPGEPLPLPFELYSHEEGCRVGGTARSIRTIR